MRNSLLALKNTIDLYQDRVFIIHGEKNALENVIKRNMDLYNTFNIKMDIPNYSGNYIKEKVINKLKNKYNLENSFVTKLNEYIDYTYENSELKNIDYIDNLYKTIAYNNYTKEGDFNTITENEIPKYVRKRDINEILKDLEKLVGLEDVKVKTNEFIDLIQFSNKIGQKLNINLHMIFTGNSGTGKTTVARVIAEILYNLGYVKENKLIEVSAKDLIAGYIGQTAIKTQTVVDSAIDGVLFIDEAYSIIGIEGNKSNFSGDCISTLIKAMEDNRDNLLIIFAGYKEEMEEFIEFNPGIFSRIGYNIFFEDYTTEQLLDIFMFMLEKNKFTMTNEAKEKVTELIEKAIKVKNFGNARFIRNLIQKVILKHVTNSKDIVDLKKLMIITDKDVSEEMLKDLKQDKKIGF